MSVCSIKLGLAWLRESKCQVSFTDPEWNEQFEFFIMGTEVLRQYSSRDGL